MKNLKILCFLLTYLVCFSLSFNPNQRLSIHDDWTVSISNCPPSSQSTQKKYQFNTSIPSTIHLDLFKNGKIKDPFFGSNWEQQKWISQCKANYKRNITLPQDLLKYQVLNLVFEGIDTYSVVKLNSKEIIRTQNAFVQYKANVKHLLKVGINLLEVQINSTKAQDDKGQTENKMPFDYAHTRKACYQYSWDWAPYMNTLGIWKGVYIEGYDEIKIEYVWVQLQRLEEKQALIHFSIKSDTNVPLSKLEKYQIIIAHNEVELNRSKLGGGETYVVVKINQPKLWWPNGIGEPFIYDFNIKLLVGQTIIHSKKVPYGIRTVYLDQTANAFTLILNGYRVYCKGANYVPPDMMYPRLLDSKKITTLLQDAVRSNFNMIRVWGGGQYESDEFYELASRKGIMIFHDFMFSDSIYPSDQKFLDNVLVEVVQQIRRIRNHPALVLWAGNNQILQGIQSWGWSSAKYKEDYKKLFEEHIPSIIKKQSPYIPYIPSSPVKGVGNSRFQRGGDVHYWGVWAGGAPFQNYETAIGPFNSEFGTQSLPVWQTIKQFTTQAGRSYESKQLLSHERHNSQFHTLKKYMEMYTKKSKSFQLQAYQSGLVQAYAIEIAIKAQRATKNTRSMGTLYWQFNDAWPAISWSAIDYYGRWKPLQYKAKNLYEDLIAFYHHRSKNVVVINDYLYGVKCFVETKIVTFTGEVLRTYNQTVQLRENQAKNVLSLKMQHNLLETNGSNVVVFTKLITAQNKQVTVSTFIKPFKELQLPKCQLQVKFDFGNNIIMLASKCLIKSLHLYHGSKYLSFTDNYMDIVPGQIHKTSLLGEELKKIEKQIKFRSYLQIDDEEKLKVIYVV